MSTARRTSMAITIVEDIPMTDTVYGAEKVGLKVIKGRQKIEGGKNLKLESRIVTIPSSKLNSKPLRMTQGGYSVQGIDFDCRQGFRE